MTEVFNELKLRSREFFESKLALAILNSKDSFHTVKKISKEIVRLMIANQAKVMALIASDQRIVNELREPYFGGLYADNQEASASDVFAAMYGVLNGGQQNLCQVMQVHCVFIYRLYDELEGAKDKQEWHKKLHPEFFFSAGNRARVKVTTSHPVTKQLGITQNTVFSKMLGESKQFHKRALDTFKPDGRSSFFKASQEKHLPFVCGPSSHTSSLLIGAKLYTDLSTEELKEYAMIIFAFLAAGGNHSFHEVMSIAKLAGLNYQDGNYCDVIPMSFKSSEAYQSVSNHFSQFL